VKHVVVAGSYRRAKETVGDIDILVTARPDSPVIDRFIAYGEVAEVTAKGGTRASVRLASRLQVDLRVVPAGVDAVTIAFTRLGPETGGWQAPAAAVTIAVVTNTLVKLGIALTAGAEKFRQYVTTALGIMAILGAGVGAVVFARF
jgi:hypothetical protein